MFDNTTPAPIALTCSECGVGHYYDFWAGRGLGWACDNCDHEIATCDVDLESGETLTTDDTGALAYLPAADPIHTECRRCGADIALTDGQWVDVNGGVDGDAVTCSQAPRPNYGPHLPAAD